MAYMGMDRYTVQRLIEKLAEINKRSAVIEVAYRDAKGGYFYANSGYTVEQLEAHLRANVEPDLCPCVCFIEGDNPRKSVILGVEVSRNTVYLHVQEFAHQDGVSDAWWLGL